MLKKMINKNAKHPICRYFSSKLICTTNEENYIRLSRYMAEKGIASRRESQEMIANGLVKLNGIIITETAYKIDRTKNHAIELDASVAEKERNELTIMLNKPLNVVSCLPENFQKKPAVHLLVKDNYVPIPNVGNDKQSSFNATKLKKLGPCGRLDENSTGLLLFSQSGVVAKKIINNNNEEKVEKEYVAVVEKLDFKTSDRFKVNKWFYHRDRDENEFLYPNKSTLPKYSIQCGNDKSLSILRDGYLSIEGTKLQNAGVEWDKKNVNTLRFTLIEGRKHQIRRMCELVGFHVVSLERVRIGNLKLGNLPLGKWTVVDPECIFNRN